METESMATTSTITSPNEDDVSDYMTGLSAYEQEFSTDVSSAGKRCIHR